MIKIMKISKQDRQMLSKLALMTAETALNTYAQRRSADPKNPDNKVYLVLADLNLRTAEEDKVDTSDLRARLNIFESGDYRSLAS